jgi:hypothetical protein
MLNFFPIFLPPLPPLIGRWKTYFLLNPCSLARRVQIFSCRSIPRQSLEPLGGRYYEAEDRVCENYYLASFGFS